MSQTLESPRWQAVGLVIDLNAKDHLAGRYGVVQDLVAWFKAIRLFRDAEDQQMILQEPAPSDLRQHRTWLTSLIAEGERLLTEAHTAGGLPEDRVRFKLTDVEAALENLRTDERVWHGSLPKERRAEILKAIFDVEKPGT
jgi:hypothetical protein